MKTAIGKRSDVLALCLISLVSKRMHMRRVVGALTILLQFVALPSGLAAISVPEIAPFAATDIRAAPRTV